MESNIRGKLYIIVGADGQGVYSRQQLNKQNNCTIINTSQILYDHITNLIRDDWNNYSNAIPNLCNKCLKKIYCNIKKILLKNLNISI